MNILRKAMAAEAERLKPLLERAYHAIGRYQSRRTAEEERLLREALAPAIDQLMVFKPYMPTYKQEYFDLLADHWRSLSPGDLIMLFDHCVSIMHLRLSRPLTAEEAAQPWSRELLALLDQRRAAPEAGPAEGDFLCSGIAASPGRFVGVARVVRTEAEMGDLRPGEVLVCPMPTPEWTPVLQRAGAVVTDQGGALCHAAIVARELAKPAVTGCGNATTVIRTGDRVEVNGDLGLVTRP